MQFSFNASNCRIDINDASLSGFVIRAASAWVSYYDHLGGKISYANLGPAGADIHQEEFADLHGSGTLLSIQSHEMESGLALTYRVKHYTAQPFVLLQFSITNSGESPIFLHEFCILDAGSRGGGAVRLGSGTSALKFFKVGWHGWDYSGVRSARERNSGGLVERLTSLSYTNPSTRRLRARGEFSSEGWGMLADGERCLVVGFVSMASQFGQVYVSIRNSDAVLSLVTQLDGARLDPGEQRASEWGYLQLVALPEPEPQAVYLNAVARQMHARVPSHSPPAMWTHWYQFFHDISEERYLHSLDVLSEHRASFPCQVTELDDGYQQAWGDWTITNERFPHGLEWLAGEVRKRGFTPGLWLAPFAVQAKSLLVHSHPDWLVKDSHGQPASAGFLYNMFIHPLDLTHPAVLEHLRGLASKLTQEWGYRMLKIDFLNAGALPGQRSNPRLTRAEALRMGLEAIREGAGEDTFLLGCGCPFGPAIGLVDAMRIGPDTAPSWTPYFHWLKWAGPLLKSNPNMPALRNAVRNTLNLSSLHKKWWWNDPDCLLVRESGSKLTGAEVQSFVTLVGLSGGLLVSSDDLGQVSAERLEWLSRLVPSLGLRGEALELLEKDMPGVYRAVIEHQGQHWQLVGLFNWSDQPADLELKFSRLGYDPGSSLHLFDFWEAKYQRTSKALVVFPDVPPHSCKLLRICEAGEVPQVVGDTLHISMGLEVVSLRIVNGNIEPELMDMERKMIGNLWVRNGEDVIVKQVN